ncbi:MAG: anti-sigma factor family protein [Endomicrobiia bacterium]
MEKCKEFTELIHAYIDNELSAEETEQVKSHLGSCALCRVRVEIFKNLKMTLKEKIVPVPAPVSLKERIMKRQAKQTSVYSIFSFPRWAYAIVSIIVIFSGIIFYQQKTKPSHFLVLHADTKIQEHLDNCPDCQKGAVKTIKTHIEITADQKVQAQLQKHLNKCKDCEIKIVKMVKECMESMAKNIHRKESSETFLAMGTRNERKYKIYEF